MYPFDILINCILKQLKDYVPLQDLSFTSYFMVLCFNSLTSFTINNKRIKKKIVKFLKDMWRTEQIILRNYIIQEESTNNISNLKKALNINPTRTNLQLLQILALYLPNDLQINRNDISIYNVYISQQNNTTDCGLYCAQILHYLHTFPFLLTGIVLYILYHTNGILKNTTLPPSLGFMISYAKILTLRCNLIVAIGALVTNKLKISSTLPTRFIDTDIYDLYTSLPYFLPHLKDEM